MSDSAETVSGARRRRRGRSVAVLLGLSITALVMEAALQAMDVLPLENSPLRGYHRYDETLGWLGTPDHVARFSGPEFELTIANGPGGFRRSEVRFEGPADAPATVFLGDSFTWGWGVEQGEVFTDLLQRELQGTERILNRGVNAFGTAQQRLLLERLLAEESFERVVVMVFANDPGECANDRGGKRPQYVLADGALELHNVPVREKLTGPFRELAKRSVVLSHLRSFVNDLTRPIRDDETAWLERADDAGAPEGWEVCRALLVDLRDRCAAAGVAFRLVYVPLAGEVAVPADERGERWAFRSLVAELCASEAIEWLDLTPGFQDAWAQSPAATERGLRFYYPIDQHWTAAGHALASRLIASRLFADPWRG